MLYLTSLFCLLHTRKIQLFDDNEHRPIFGSCKHTICLECFQNKESSSCPFCQKENAFEQAVPNFAAIDLIKQRREDFWGTLKMWWSGENYGEGLCSKCVKTKTLRICLKCHRDKLRKGRGGELRLQMRSEKDLVNLARHVVCSDCFLEEHAEKKHKCVKIDDIRYSKKHIRMTTAKIILELFIDGMEKKKGFIDCKLRYERVKGAGPLWSLLRKLDYTDEDECGYLGELIKMELIKKYIDDMDKKLNELFNKDHEENQVCECTQLYEKLERLGDEWALYNYDHMSHPCIEIFTPGCPLYFKSHLKNRLKLYKMIGEAPPGEITPEPFNDRQCPTCVFFDQSKHQQSQKDFYVENWIDIVDKLWRHEMPSFEKFCVRCLEEFNKRNIGSSCEKLNKEERIGIRRSIRYEKQNYNRIPSDLLNKLNELKKSCEHTDCLMRDRDFWKCAIIGHISRIWNYGLENIASNCQLWTLRMQQLTSNVHRMILNLNLRKNDRSKFCAKTVKVDRLFESLKTQWNSFRNEPQVKSPCKCTVICENISKMIDEKNVRDDNADQKYCNLKIRMIEMAFFSFKQDISGCPMDFDHGIVLDASVLEELEYIYSDDYSLTFEMMGITFGN
ncbi:unnamed protein product [Caenorhabditis brenneri]